MLEALDAVDTEVQGWKHCVFEQNAHLVIFSYLLVTHVLDSLVVGSFKMKALMSCGGPVMMPTHAIWGAENSLVGTNYSWGSTGSVDENSERVVLNTVKVSLSPSHLQGESVHQSFAHMSSNVCNDALNEQQNSTKGREQDSPKLFTGEGGELSFTSSRSGSSSGELCSYQFCKGFPECTQLSHETGIHAQGETNRSYGHSVVLDLGDTAETKGISLLAGSLVAINKDVFDNDKMQYSTMALVKRTCDPTNAAFAYRKELGQSKSPGRKYLDQNLSSLKDFTTEDALTQELHGCDLTNGSCLLRTCSHCGTAKTPLWRTGPQGPKSLCNACGIRFKKSRKCSEGSEGMESEGSHPATQISNNVLSTGSLKRKQDTVTSVNFYSSLNEDNLLNTTKRVQNHSKRISWQQGLPSKKSCHQGEDASGSCSDTCLTWNLQYHSSHSQRPISANSPSSPSSKGLAMQTKDGKREAKSASPTTQTNSNNITRGFGKDEEEAAALLMAISCGVVNA